MLTQHNRGSEWHKWDLHIHTPKSFESKYGGETPEIWEKFITELENLDPAIKVIGINDYLFLDGYKEVLRYRNEGRLQNIDLILPVLEFRLNQFVGSKELGRINYHVIFANEDLLDTSIIESQFLHRLVSSAMLDSDYGESWAGVLNRKTLQDFGQVILDSTPRDKRPNISPILMGFNNLNFSLDEIEKILGEKDKPNTYLKNKYFKIIGKNEWEDFRWDGSPADKKSIINSAHFVFAASATVEQASSGIINLKQQEVNSRLLHCSDAHCFCENKEKTKPKDLGHCFLWIKGETTFEGLRQVYYEPELRIKIQEEEPELKDNALIIDEVRFISNLFTPEPIRFNRNLNVIIGGKSSGKSVLLYYIAYLLRINNDENSLYQTKNERGDNIDIYSFHNNINSSFDFEVKLLSGVSDSISAKRRSILPYIKYIPQNYLTKLADSDSNKTSNDLNKIVRNLLNEDIDYKERYDCFIERVKIKDKEREQLIDDYFDLLEKKNDYQKQVEVLGDKTAIEASKKSKETEVENLKIKAKLTPQQIEEYANLTTQLDEIKKRIIKQEQDYNRLANFGSYAIEVLNNLTQKYNEEILDIAEPLENKFAPYFSAIQQALVGVKNFQAYLSSEEGKDFKKNLEEEKHTQESRIQKGLEPFITNKEDQVKIQYLERSIESDQDKLVRIELIIKEIEDINTVLISKKADLLKSFRDTHQEYVKIIDLFSSRIDSIKNNDLNIEGKPIYNFSKFRKYVYPQIHGNRTVNKDYNKFSLLDDKWSRDNQLEFDRIIDSLSNLFESVLSGEFVLNSSSSSKQFFKSLFDDYFYDYWTVSYKGDLLGVMSTGKASFVILMLIIGLSKEKGPILIDQPEDNLDNRSISMELVNYLREKKQERQIILVTHNPNIVVNADAENVIVAEQKGQREIIGTTISYKFDYINGALENTFIDNNETDILKRQGIKEHVAEIVEGGEEAFIKRERKYNFARKRQ